MKSSERSEILLLVLSHLHQEGSWCGETHVQKSMFICQEIAGLQSDFKFILYKHGPYSFQLSESLQSLISDELVTVKPRPPYGPSLCLSIEAEALASKAKKLRNMEERVSFVATRLGRKGVTELEKLATAVFINGSLGIDSSVRGKAVLMTSIKPHVQLQAAEEAFGEVDLMVREASQLLK